MKEQAELLFLKRNPHEGCALSCENSCIELLRWRSIKTFMPVCMYVYVYMCPHFFLGTLIKLFVCLLSELCALHEYKELLVEWKMKRQILCQLQGVVTRFVLQSSYWQVGQTLTLPDEFFVCLEKYKIRHRMTADRSKEWFWLVFWLWFFVWRIILQPSQFHKRR